MVDCVIKNWQGEEVGQATLNLRVAKEERTLTADQADTGMSMKGDVRSGMMTKLTVYGV